LFGLDENNLRRFQAGQALFNRVFKPEDGLGPLFNGDQCSACHTQPAAGGTGEQFLHRASRFNATKQCDLLSGAGGENIRVLATPALRSLGIVRQPPPDQATEGTRFNVPFIFGLGLVEAVPEERILRRADPDDADGDGISGRPGVDAQGRFSRFGRKADQPTLRSFIESAAHFEMGLTTPSHPDEGTLAGKAFPAGVDPVPGLELSEAEAELITDFVRFLTPPAQRNSSQIVKRSMTAKSCFMPLAARCHTPTMTTGRHEIPRSATSASPFTQTCCCTTGTRTRQCLLCGRITDRNAHGASHGLGLRSVYLHDSRPRASPKQFVFTAARQHRHGRASSH
jgi:CxxC motif-containing protein (DUF1111 family)